jgi:sugar phosphate isomerase/epimerase
MKLAFCDKIVNESSFLSLCNAVQYYGYDGIEIFDAKAEKAAHVDSIFHSSVTADAKRKLVNRHITIPVIDYPEMVNENTDGEKIVKYVEYAALCGATGVNLVLENLPEIQTLKKVLSPAIACA